jgi:alkylation response protein AidB-like acyl-CoA dehydrogenase
MKTETIIEHPSAYLKPDWIEIIRRNSADAERAGKLQPAQLALIYQQQWFKLLAPAVYSGAERPLPELLRIEEALAWANGSLGWVVTLCCGAGWFGGFLAPGKAGEVFALEEVCLAGSGAATGEAQITSDGYKVTGKWKYESGVHHATHFTANCIIKDGVKPITDEDGNPLILPFIFDRKDVKIIPAWKMMGMMATGSDAFEVSNLEVPCQNCFKIDPEAAVIKNPLYLYPFRQLAETTLAANISGIAIHFIDLAKKLIESRIQHKTFVEVHQEQMRRAVDEADTRIREARADLYHAADTSWVKMTAGELDEKSLSVVSSTSRTLAKTVREWADELYPYCGLAAADIESEINQAWRDLHTASQHSLLTFV